MMNRRGWMFLALVICLGFSMGTAGASSRAVPSLAVESGGEEPQAPQAKLVELVKVTRVNANLRGVTRHVDGSFWVVGYDGVIARLDADLNPVASITSGVKVPLFDVSFIDEKTGFIVGGSAKSMEDPKKVPGPTMLRTNDGGTTWTEQSVPYGWAELTDITWFDARMATVIGLGMALRTDDGGVSWKSFDQGFKPRATGLVRVSDTIGFILGLDGNVMKTTDAGMSWRKVSVAGDGHPYGGCFVDDKTGFLSGQMGVRVTNDGGETWSQLEGSPQDTYAIVFTSASTGYVFGRSYSGGCFGTHSARVHCTRDGGKTWPEQQNLRELGGLCERLIPCEPGIWVGVAGRTVFKLRFL